MKPTPFNPERDLATMPFSQGVRDKALQLKQAGLPWMPHVGCFVWDADEHIRVSSPFPGRIYFILNLGHFLSRFQTIDGMIEKLVWLPTHHQARLLLEQYGMSNEYIHQSIEKDMNSADELLVLYELLFETLSEKQDH